MLGLARYEMPFCASPMRPFYLLPPSDLCYIEGQRQLAALQSQRALCFHPVPLPEQPFPSDSDEPFMDTQLDTLPPSLYQMHEESISKLDVLRKTC